MPPRTEGRALSSGICPRVSVTHAANVTSASALAVFPAPSSSAGLWRWRWQGIRPGRLVTVHRTSGGTWHPAECPIRLRESIRSSESAGVLRRVKTSLACWTLHAVFISLANEPNRRRALTRKGLQHLTVACLFYKERAHAGRFFFHTLLMRGVGACGAPAESRCW